MEMKLCPSEQYLVVKIFPARGLYVWVSKVFIFKDSHNSQTIICWKNNDQAMPWDLEVVFA